MRQPKPWFRSSLNAWYVEHRGRQVRLGVHPDGAPPPKKSKAGWNAPQAILDAFYKLMASDPADLPRPDAVLTAQVLDLFLDHSERHNERPTFLWYRHFLRSFAGMYGRLPARELKPIHVSRWLDAHAWKGGRRNAVVAVKRAFNWADKQGVLSPNPLRSVEKAGVLRGWRKNFPVCRTGARNGYCAPVALQLLWVVEQVPLDDDVRDWRHGGRDGLNWLPQGANYSVLTGDPTKLPSTEVENGILPPRYGSWPALSLPPARPVARWAEPLDEAGLLLDADDPHTQSVGVDVAGRQHDVM